MSDGTAAPQKAKKLPFKPTALRNYSSGSPATTQDASNPPDGTPNNEEYNAWDLFSRSKDMAPRVEAERERRLRRKLRRQKSERRRRKSEAKAQDDEALDGDDTIQSPLDTSAVAEGSVSPTASDSVKTPKSLSATPISPPSKRARRKSSRDSSSDAPKKSKRSQRSSSCESRSQRKKPTPPNNVICLDSDSEDDMQVTSSLPHPRSPSPPPAAPEPAKEENQFAEYIERAREQRALYLQKSQASTAGSIGAGSSQPQRHFAEIVVSSAIHGTEPILVKFTYDKHIRFVRDSWIALQRRKEISLPIEANTDIIMTWNRRKVYAYTTLQDLGIHPSLNEMDWFYDDEPPPVKPTRVQFEAWTAEQFAKYEEEEAMRRKRAAGELPEEPDERDIAAARALGLQLDAESGEYIPEKRVKIVLKPRSLPELRLSVRLETNVKTLIAAFRHEREVPKDADVSLWFDGEKMEDETTIDNAELDDLDTLEVHIKE